MEFVKRLSIAAIVAASLAACDAGDPAAPAMPGPDQLTSAASIRGGWDLPLESAEQLGRSFPAEPCSTADHRAFDFWVGDWNVYSTDGTQLWGTNAVTSELDGCLVQEHWTAAGGFQGRSLNVYDRETGQWHQDWASQVPQAYIGRLRTSGGLDADGVMVLTGVRPSRFGYTWLDEWTWTETPEGDVIQTGQAYVPEFDVTPVNFAARYRSEPISPATPAASNFCGAGGPGAPTRAGDFLVGDWQVRTSAGRAVASSSVESALTGCLFIEELETVGGLQATAYTYWDFTEAQWFRIYVDSEGERLALRGDFDGTSLVFTGTEGSVSGDVDVRLTFTPGAGTVTQTWEVSRNGGDRWTETARLTYEAI